MDRAVELYSQKQICSHDPYTDEFPILGLLDSSLVHRTVVEPFLQSHIN